MIESLFKRAFWLGDTTKRLLADAFKTPLFTQLSQKNQKALACILLSILYGEECFIRMGKRRTLYIDNILKLLRLQKYLCTTLGMWNFNVCHAAHFGYSKSAFRNLLEDPIEATQLIIRHLTEDIGIEKAPELIFAEYNHNIMATSITALQKGLNSLFSCHIQEDGLIGPETIYALDSCAPYLPEFFSLNGLNEEMVLQTLDYLRMKHGISFAPSVPHVVIKKDFRYIGSILKQSLHDIRRLKRLRGLFERDIDIPAYVKNCKEAYAHLTKEVQG